MAREYKAIQYKVTIHHDSIEDVVPGYDCHEIRYCIISTETGEILDDAQGYGYKTAQKAYSAYAYKTRDKTKDKERLKKKKHIEKWMKDHTSFVKEMDVIAFEIAKGSCKPDSKFNADLIKEMLISFNLKPDFTASDLLKVWRDR